MNEVLTDLAYGTGWAAVRHLPEPVAQSLFRSMGNRAWERRGRGVVQLERNLARVLPDATDAELQRVSQEGMRRYFRYWCEAFRLPAMSRETLLERVDIGGMEHMLASFDAGRPTVIAASHMGNWDLAGAWLAVKYGDRYPGRVLAVAERLKPESLFDRFVAYRESLGMEILPLSSGEGAGDSSLIGKLSARLRAGGVIGLVADRDFGGRGVPVDFFGETAPMPPGPARLALATGAALHAVTLWHTDDGRLSGLVSPSVEPGDVDRSDPAAVTAAIAEMTQRVTDCFAKGIAAHPADWHMLQRIWAADRAATG